MPKITKLSWLKSYIELDPILKSMLMAGLANHIGIGLARPIGLLFATRVLGIAVEHATLIISVTSVGAFIGHPLIGYFADKRSVYGAAIIGASFSFAGSILYATASNFHTLIIAAFITGLGLSTSTAWSALLSQAAQPEERLFVFGVNHVCVNIGIGVGAAIAGLVISFPGELTYRALFIGKGVGFLALSLVLISFHRHKGKMASTIQIKRENMTATEPCMEPVASSARSTRLTFSLVSATVLILYMFGYAQFDAGLIAAIVDSPTLPAWTVSAVSIVNTVAVVALNVITVPRIKGIRPILLALLIPIIWAGAWLISASSLTISLSAVGVVTICIGVTVFSFGEVLYAVAIPTMTTELIGPEYAGRAFGLQNLMTSIGFILGPMFAAFLLSHGGGTLTLIGCALGLILTLLPLSLVRKLLSVPLPFKKLASAKAFDV